MKPTDAEKLAEIAQMLWDLVDGIQAGTITPEDHNALVRRIDWLMRGLGREPLAGKRDSA
jgi:hypothetical protein